MKCSKCGAEIKNLPEYIAETGADVVCTKCSGVLDEEGGTRVTLDRLRSFRSYLDFSNELDVAA